MYMCNGLYYIIYVYDVALFLIYLNGGKKYPKMSVCIYLRRHRRQQNQANEHN